MAIARFVRGSTTFDINAAPYSLSDFVPPSTAFSYNLAGGTSANVYGGSTKVGQKAVNAELSFTVRILGAGNTYINQSARRLAAFVKSDSAEPLYFEWEAGDLPEPLWGQLGAPKRYEVVTADVEMGTQYTDKKLRALGVNVGLSMSIKPFTLGTKQRLASALGGIWLDTIGEANGEAWGLRIPEATTNKMTNPVFSHATWNTNWTAGASIIAAQNTDPVYCFPGSYSSALLTSKTAATNTYSQSIAAGNTNKHSFSALVARPDGEAVTSNDCVFWYNVALATTFRHLGNGIYLAYSDNVTGIAAATVTGLQVKIGRSVYLLGMQMEEKLYHTPITYGDMLGNAWAGTVAESTSARAAGRVSIPVASDTFINNLWGIHFIWKPDYPNTQAGDRYLFSAGAANIRMTYTAADDKINLLDNTNTASTAALTFSAGDVLEVLAVGGNSGLAVYAKNHTTGNTYSGTNATYTVPAAATSIFIGTDDSAANHAGGIFQLFETYNDDLTSAQNTLLQTAVGAIAAAGYKVGDIPWLWTKDGDNVVDNYEDATHNTFAVCGGIPGSIVSDTEYLIAPSYVNMGYWFGVCPIDYGAFVSQPSRFFFFDYSGAVVADSVGGQAHDSSPGTSPAAVAVANPRAFNGKTVSFLARIIRKSAGAGAAFGSYYFSAGGSGGSTPYCNFTAPTLYNLYYLGQVYIDAPRNSYATDNINFGLQSGANNLYYDLMMIIPGEILRIPNLVQTFTYLHVHNSAVSARSSALQFAGYTPAMGTMTGLSPSSLNMLWFITASHDGLWDITRTATYTQVHATPRWSLL